MKFQDSKFMSARDKELVLKAWIGFLKSGFRWERFTGRLYKHLSGHCGFIAHYNQRGFWEEYFQDPESTKRFLQYLTDPDGSMMGSIWWPATRDSIADINKAMLDALEPLKKGIYQQLNQATVNKVTGQIAVLNVKLSTL